MFLRIVGISRCHIYNEKPQRIIREPMVTRNVGLVPAKQNLCGAQLRSASVQLPALARGSRFYARSWTWLPENRCRIKPFGCAERVKLNGFCGVVADGCIENDFTGRVWLLLYPAGQTTKLPRAAPCPARRCARTSATNSLKYTTRPSALGRKLAKRCKRAFRSCMSDQ